MKSTLVIKDLSEAKDLDNKEMSAIVGGLFSGFLDVLIKPIESAGEIAGSIYCSVKGPNCGGATTKPKTNT